MATTVDEALAREKRINDALLERLTQEQKSKDLDKLNNAYNIAVSNVRATLFTKIKTKALEIKNNFISDKNVLNTLTDIKNGVIELASAVSVYNTAITNIKTKRANDIDKLYANSVPVNVSATINSDTSVENYKNKKLNINGLEIDLGLNESTEALGVVDPTILPDNNVGLYLQFEGTKVKLNSIQELIDVVKSINKILDTKDASTVRAWVHKIVKTHPLIDNEIKDLKYFKPISEEVGSTYLLYTPDTQTLQLNIWSSDIPIAVRNLLKYKVREDVYDKMNKVYNELNIAMTKNISSEFFYEWEDAYKNNTNKNIYSNDFHIVGDSSFNVNHIGTQTLKMSLMVALINYLGSSAKLINWLVPINNYKIAINSGVKISVEGNTVVVDLKGDKVGVIATVIDETAITNIENE